MLRGESTEAIHGLRVSARRLQAMLDLLYPAPQPRPIEKLRRKLRRSRRALSDVRNCDVLLEKTDAMLARKRTTRRAAWEAVRDYLAERRPSAAARAGRKLSNLNLGALYVRFRECLLDEKDPNSAPAAPPVSSAAPGVIAFPHEAGTRQFRRSVAPAIERRWREFEASIAEPDGGRPGFVHGARLATKRLRYLVEVVHHFDAAGSREALSWLKRLQTGLGDWRDLEVLERTMLEMVARPRFLRRRLQTAMEIERLVVGVRTRKRRLEERCALLTLGLGSAEGSSERRRLAQWVAGFVRTPAA